MLPGEKDDGATNITLVAANFGPSAPRPGPGPCSNALAKRKLQDASSDLLSPSPVSIPVTATCPLSLPVDNKLLFAALSGHNFEKLKVLVFDFFFFSLL